MSLLLFGRSSAVAVSALATRSNDKIDTSCGQVGAVCEQQFVVPEFFVVVIGVQVSVVVWIVVQN